MEVSHLSYLGLDLGTSGLKALLINESGQVLGSATRGYPVSQPIPGGSEQNPADWIEALESVIGELKVQHAEFAELKGIGVSGQMHGAVLLDEAGSVLRPCLLWNDTRAHAEAARFDRADQSREITGNIMFPGFTAPKVEWVRAHEPEVFGQISKVLLPAAYLNHYLSGDFFADRSDSSGTGWLNTADGDWSDPLLARSGLDRGHMPRLIDGTQAGGQLRGDLKGRWGLKHSPVIAGGAGDNAAAAVGLGVLGQGQGFVSLGTSGVVLAARDDYSAMPDSAVHTFCHAGPNAWYQMGVMLAATDSLNWLAGLLRLTPQSLVASLAPRPTGPGQVMYLPYLAGERTPHNDAQVRGGFLSLSISTDTRDMTQAVLEGVAYGLLDSLSALRSAGADPGDFLATGGGAHSEYWLALLATLFDRAIHVPKQSEVGAAMGAARLAIVAADPAGTLSDISQRPATAHVFEPNAALRPVYADAYARFQCAYPAIRPFSSIDGPT